MAVSPTQTGSKSAWCWWPPIIKSTGFPASIKFWAKVSRPLVRAAVLGTHVGEDDEGIRLGQDLIVVVEDGLGHVFEDQSLGGTDQE